MTLQQFNADYFCSCSINSPGVTKLQIVSKVLARSDGRTVGSVETIVDIESTYDWIVDSQSPESISPTSWERLIDLTKRAQLDYFAQRMPIENWYPLNTETVVCGIYE